MRGKGCGHHEGGGAEGQQLALHLETAEQVNGDQNQAEYRQVHAAVGNGVFDGQDARSGRQQHQEDEVAVAGQGEGAPVPPGGRGQRQQRGEAEDRPVLEDAARDGEVPIHIEIDGAFKDLLKAWGRTQDLTFVPEYQLETRTKDRRYADGALLHTLRVPFGYWEAKDSNDDLDEEIKKKFRAGYPKTNIIFEDSTQAVLFQNADEVMRCSVEDTDR